MKNMPRRILTSIAISFGVYFGIAALLIAFGTSDMPANEDNGPAFSELFFDYSGLPGLKSFTARDGSHLGYRYYPSEAETDKVVILLHGAGWHSQYFLPLADFISSEGLANVYTPDLRGHGPNPEKRGDIDYIGQFEDDIADLITIVREEHPDSILIVEGHSSGGGLAIRFAGSQYGNQADAYLLLSPFLKYNAPTTRSNSGGFANPYTKRIAGLNMLNNLGIHRFDYLPAIEFNIPEEARDGTETLSYSHRLMTAYAPSNYKKDISAITQPLLVVAGTADESYYAERYEPVISQYADVQVELLEGVTHMGVVVGYEVQPVVKEWLKDLAIP